MLARNEDTIQNIRLWDARPLLQTYQQTQAIRLYYQFYNVGVDRYHLADGYHQVMLATRELSPQLPAQAQTWVNQYLQFTHGYDVVMNFVSKKVGGGFPQYLIENVPAEAAYGLNITQPAIYYGESMPGYRIVATGIKEFDYPQSIRAWCPELPIDAIEWTRGRRIADCGPDRLAPHDALQAHRPHQTRHGAAGDRNPFPAELSPDLADAIDAEVLGVHAPDLDLQGSARRAAWA